MSTHAPIYIAPRDPMTPPPPRVPAADVDQLFARLMGLCGRLLPEQRLLPGQRQHLGGRISWISGPLAKEVAFGLAGKAEHFPDLPFAAEQLREHQGAAEAWQLLRDTLLTLADLAQDGYVAEQCQAQQMAEQVLKQVKAGVENPRLAPHLDHKERLAAMRLAFLMVERYKDTLVRRRQNPPPARKAARRPVTVGERFRAEVRSQFGAALRDARTESAPPPPPVEVPPPPPPVEVEAPPPAPACNNFTPLRPAVQDVYAPAAPIPGTSASITNDHAIWVDVWEVPVD